MALDGAGGRQLLCEACAAANAAQAGSRPDLADFAAPDPATAVEGIPAPVGFDVGVAVPAVPNDDPGEDPDQVRVEAAALAGELPQAVVQALPQV